MRERVVHCGEVHLDDLLALFPVSLADGILDGPDRSFVRQHAGDGEEACLHHRVDAPAHSALPRHAAGVDDEQPRPLLLEAALRLLW